LTPIEFAQYSQTQRCASGLQHSYWFRRCLVVLSESARMRMKVHARCRICPTVVRRHKRQTRLPRSRWPVSVATSTVQSQAAVDRILHRAFHPRKAAPQAALSYQAHWLLTPSPRGTIARPLNRPIRVLSTFNISHC